MSDLSRVYASGKEPGLIAGTATSYAAGAGVPAANGKELAHAGNSDKGHDYKSDLGR